MNVALNELAPGQRGIVSGFADDTDLSLRLMELGVVEGAELLVLRRAPAGDPIEIDVMGYALSLRRDEAASVLVDPTRP